MPYDLAGAASPGEADEAQNTVNHAHQSPVTVPGYLPLRAARGGEERKPNQSSKDWPIGNHHTTSVLKSRRIEEYHCGHPHKLHHTELLKMHN